MLAQDTPLLLLDEPANALDLAHQVSVMSLLSKLCREQRKTVVMVGHDLTLAHSVSSHALLLMGDGRWLAGPVEDVMQPAVLERIPGPPNRNCPPRRTHHLHSRESPMSDINDRHRDRMARKKAIIDAKIAAADKNIGVLIVNTGNGKGKSSERLRHGDDAPWGMA